jgi:SMODS and SLOG-associating 2TM effector domain 1/SMODS and SLOG-associating 2TM effector domain 3
MDDMFHLVWRRYRIWTITSRHLKTVNESWKRRLILLTLAGTACGTLAPFAGRWLEGPWPARIVALLGTVCLALATYLGKELLDSKREERWMRARIAAEVYKSEASKYLVQVAPYEAPDRTARLSARLAELDPLTKGLVPEQVSEAETTAGMPGAWWSVDEYVAKRLTEQIDWYRARAGDHTRATAKGRKATLTLGGIAVLLSAVTGATASDGTLPAGLLGIVTTAGGAIGGYFQAGHYEALALKYRETADALERRRAEFATAAVPDQHRLVADVEGILQAENAAWLSQLTTGVV